MKFELTTHQGVINKRYKRFFADITLENGQEITAHTPNTGSMKTCYEPGWKSLVTQNNDPKRKLKYTLEMTHNGRSWIGVNTNLTNKLVKEALENKIIKQLDCYDVIRPEVKYGDSRIDFCLTDSQSPEKKHFVEVKNVTYSKIDGLAEFPDSVTTRGQKHLKELMDIKSSGQKATMLFIIQREDVSDFSPAKEIDPEYTELLIQAKNKGVQVLAYQCSLNEKEILIKNQVTISL